MKAIMLPLTWKRHFQVHYFIQCKDARKKNAHSTYNPEKERGRRTRRRRNVLRGARAGAGSIVPSDTAVAWNEVNPACLRDVLSAAFTYIPENLLGTYIPTATKCMILDGLLIDTCIVITCMIHHACYKTAMLFATGYWFCLPCFGEVTCLFPVNVHWDYYYN